MVSCVTHPHLASCLNAAATIALVVATGGEGEAEVAAIDAAEQACTHAAERVSTHAAEKTGGNAAKDAADSCATGIGGTSVTASTKVLLASGKAVPIASLVPGEKVLATNTKTGKTRAEAIAAVLVHHDTDPYDLTVRANGRTAVIGTTANHRFWDATTRRWVKAAALKYGTHLRTPTGGTATALGGHAPQDRTGWMGDLTVPSDHDFYIDTTAADILVHNCGGTPAMPQMERVGSGQKGDLSHRSVSWAVDNPAAQRSTITGGDGVARDLYHQLTGELSDKPGGFEWIVDRSGSEPVIPHQRFMPAGRVTGLPNQ